MKQLIHKQKAYLRQTTSLSFFFFVLCINSFSQTLYPTAEAAFEPQLPFNSEYIKANKVRSITFDIIDKKDLQVAEDKGLLNYYEFNAQGKIARFYYTTIAKVIQKEYHTGAVYKGRRKISNGHSYTKNEYIYDTVSINYYYTDSLKLKLKRYNDGQYYESYYYDYTPEGQVKSEKRCRETNVSPNKYEFKLGSQLVISEESFSYQNTGKNQVKKICSNDEGRAYKEVIYNYNKEQKITLINEQYIVAWIIQQTSFVYNEEGRLISAVYKGNTNGDQEESRTYDYDANGCVLTEKQYKNGVLQKEISYVTDANKKLNSYLIRDPNQKNIRIVKLYYQYY